MGTRPRPSVLQRVLDHQWERELPRGARLRIGAVFAWIVFLSFLGFVGRRDLFAALPGLLAYLVLAILASRRMRRLDWLRRWSATVLDIPMLALAMHPLIVPPDQGYIPVASWAFNFGVIIANPAVVYEGPLAASCVAGLFVTWWHLQAAQGPGSWYVGTAMIYTGIFVLTRASNRRLVDIAEDYVREKKLAAFFSPAVAEDLRNDAASQRGRLQEVTVLVSDIRGFTSIAEDLGAEDVVALLNEYLAGASAIVAKHGGTIDKFLGDGMLAYFTAQSGAEDHAIRAVRCGLEMLATIERLNERKTLYGEQSLSMGIGIHTGDVVVGAIGSKTRREHTIIGDAVNLTARLEGMTKALGARMLVSEAARARTGELFAWVDCGKRDVRGRVEKVAIFEPVVRSGARPQPVPVRLAPIPESSAAAQTGIATKPGSRSE